MSPQVLKFGGSSVADIGKIKAVAEQLVARRREGHQVVSVVSAMGDTTDELITLAKQVTAVPPRREMDMLVTAGERISMALLSMAVQTLGEAAVSFTGSQAGIITEPSHQGARIVEVTPVRVKEALDAGSIVIVAGYQGVSRTREVTTLGRGGSDTTAVALAGALGATTCEICSDVDGVYSADPRVCADARHWTEVDYDVVTRMAAAGAKVLCEQAIAIAKQHRVTIVARRSHGAHAKQTRVGAFASAGPKVWAVVDDAEGGVVTVVGDALNTFPAADWHADGVAAPQLSDDCVRYSVPSDDVVALTQRLHRHWISRIAS